LTEHYYSRTQQTDSNPQTWSYDLKGHHFLFKTDNGVFSKNEVDFGSRLLIETFECPALNGPILDVGCGYGPIGLFIAKEHQNRAIHMVDVNERALLLAKENAKINKIENVLIYESDRLSNVAESSFAAIVTNPPIRAGKNIVHDIYEQSYPRLQTGGEIWIVIQKKQGAPSTISKLEEIYSEVEVVSKKKGYYIIRAKKY